MNAGRTLAITQNITVDGAIEMIGDWFDPEAQDSDLLAENHRQDAGCDAVLLGRQTFTDFRSFWPEVTDDSTGITDYLNNVAKYVVSGTLDDPGWRHSTVLSGDLTEEVNTLKSQPGKDIVATGSITLCHSLLEAGLVDELRLFTYPVVQGRGRRLFPDGHQPTSLTRIDAKTFQNGVTYNAYRLG